MREAEWDEVGDVVEVQVREHDRIEWRRVAREQRREHSGAAVEQDARSTGGDEVAGTRLARIATGRRAAQYVQRRALNHSG